jgi:hypothetical protein
MAAARSRFLTGSLVLLVEGAAQRVQAQAEAPFRIGVGGADTFAEGFYAIDRRLTLGDVVAK